MAGYQKSKRPSTLATGLK